MNRPHLLGPERERVPDRSEHGPVGAINEHERLMTQARYQTDVAGPVRRLLDHVARALVVADERDPHVRVGRERPREPRPRAPAAQALDPPRPSGTRRDDGHVGVLGERGYVSGDRDRRIALVSEDVEPDPDIEVCPAGEQIL